MWMPEEIGKTPPSTFILDGGSVYTPTEEVPAGILSAVAGLKMPLDQAESGRLPNPIPQGMHGRRTAFAEWLTAADHPLTARAIVNRIWQYHFGKGLAENTNNFGATGRKPTHPELLDWLEQMGDAPEQENTLAERVARLTLLDILERNEEERAQSAVALMTLHAAKGLEFHHVFMVGMEEDILPHRNSLQDGNLEEERRLTYVGITRAQRSLVLTLAKRRKRYGELEACEPSRFLAELPQEELRWEGENQTITPEERQQRGRAHLDTLKGLLSGD